MKSLVGFYHPKNMMVLFVELSIGIKNLPHLVVDCVVLDNKYYTDCMLYFKKALLEEETEW
jgi:hypothetical protein